MMETLQTTDRLQKQMQEQRETLNQLHSRKRWAWHSVLMGQQLSQESSLGPRPKLRQGLRLQLDMGQCGGWDRA